jgi:hypothetical protein
MKFKRENLLYDQTAKLLRMLGGVKVEKGILIKTAFGDLLVKRLSFHKKRFCISSIFKEDSKVTHCGITALMGVNEGRWDLMFEIDDFTDLELLIKIENMLKDAISGTNDGIKPRV